MTAWLDAFFQDLRFALREFRTHPGFSTIAIASLALGIMAATAVYSVIHGVIIDPFPYKDIDRLMSIILRSPDQRSYRGSYTVEEYAELSRRASGFDGIAASTISDVLWTSGDEPLRLRGNHISSNGFDVMGVPALLGRAVSASESHPETKAVLGYRFWIRQFGGSPAVLGQTLVLNGLPRTIVGIMPPRFMFRGADVYLPLDYREARPAEQVDNLWVTARLRSDISDVQAAASLDPILRDLAQRSPARYPASFRVHLLPFKETFPSSIRSVLWVLFGAVGFLLLIACANVSNLLLARASARRREIAMRFALGAGRPRIFRQLLTESLALGFTGSMIGVLLSWAALKAILLIVPPDVIPDESEVVLNLPVLAFSFATCLVTAVLFGLAPALHGATGKLGGILKEGARGSGATRGVYWLRGALVALELTFAVVLLAGAGLCVRSLAQLHDSTLGVGVDHRLVVRLPLSRDRYNTPERRAAFIREALDRISGLPGVRAAAINSGIHPLGAWGVPVEIPGATINDTRSVSFHQVNQAYLAATGIKLRSGRWFEEADIASRRYMAVVNQAFVARYFNAQQPLGKIVKIPRIKRPPADLPSDQFEIIGTVDDAMHELSSGDSRPEIYIPYSMLGLAEMLLVHTAGDPMSMAPHVKAQIYAMDRAQYVDDVRTLENFLDRQIYSGGRFRVWLMGVFGVLGLALSVVGVYGLLAQLVAMEQRNIGIRMAVGASPGEILNFVLGRGARLVGAGLLAGVAVTLVLLLRFGKLLGVSDPLEPAVLIGACVPLALAGLVACLVPALRASQTNPVEALRLE